MSYKPPSLRRLLRSVFVSDARGPWRAQLWAPSSFLSVGATCSSDHNDLSTGLRARSSDETFFSLVAGPTRAGGDTRSVKNNNPTSPLGVGGLDAIFVRYQLLNVNQTATSGEGLPSPKPPPGLISAVIEMHHDFFRLIFGPLKWAPFVGLCLAPVCSRKRALEDLTMAQNEVFQGLRGALG